MRKFATKIVSRQNSVNHHSRAKFHIYFKQFKSWEEWEGWLLLLEPSYHYWVQVASHCDKVPPVKFKEKTGKYNVTRTCPSHQSVCPRQLRQGCWLWQGEAHSNGSWPPCRCRWCPWSPSACRRASPRSCCAFHLIAHLDSEIFERKNTIQITAQDITTIHVINMKSKCVLTCDKNVQGKFCLGKSKITHCV